MTAASPLEGLCHPSSRPSLALGPGEFSKDQALAGQGQPGWEAGTEAVTCGQALGPLEKLGGEGKWDPLGFILWLLGPIKPE